MVRFLGKCSYQFDQTSGVPQSSTLGPILFLIYMNDIKECFVSSKFLLFPDDLKIFKQIDNQGDINCLQEDLNRVYRWSTNNCLKMNEGKCKYIRYCNVSSLPCSSYNLGTINIPSSSTIKDLGVTFNHNFKFTQHIFNTFISANFALGKLKKLTRDFSNIAVITNIFKTLVWSKLQYCNLIWDPWQKSLTSKCESINKKFINFLNYKYPDLKLYDMLYNGRLARVN